MAVWYFNDTSPLWSNHLALRPGEWIPTDMGQQTDMVKKFDWLVLHVKNAFRSRFTICKLFFYILHIHFTCSFTFDIHMMIVMRFFVVWHVFFLFCFLTLSPWHPSWRRKVFGSPGFYLETPRPPGAAWWMATSKHVAKPFLLRRQVPQGELQKRKQRQQQRRKQKQLRLTFRFWDVLLILFILYNDFLCSCHLIL